MNTILITILIIIILILIFLILKLINNFKKSENEIEKLKNDIDFSVEKLNENFANQISNKNIETTSMLMHTIESIEQKLKSQSKEANENVKEVITRVSSLDNIKNQMFLLNENIINLEKVLNDKKLRGTFGEVRLLQIFESVFGENNKGIYEEQYQLSNGKRVDFVVHAPYPVGNIAIDSKFPLENYLNITKAKTQDELKIAKKAFEQDIKKHINDISEKYIIPNETAGQAMMFIPAESIFSYIYANEESLIQYSYEKKVWITSPTTIMAILNLLLVVLKDIKRNESYEQMYEEINKLKLEFDRFEKRWDNLSKHLSTVMKDTEELTVTTKKITKKFDDIENANLE